MNNLQAALSAREGDFNKESMKEEIESKKQELFNSVTEALTLPSGLELIKEAGQGVGTKLLKRVGVSDETQEAFKEGGVRKLLTKKINDTVNRVSDNVRQKVNETVDNVKQSVEDAKQSVEDVKQSVEDVKQSVVPVTEDIVENTVQPTSTSASRPLNLLEERPEMDLDFPKFEESLFDADTRPETFTSRFTKIFSKKRKPKSEFNEFESDPENISGFDNDFKFTDALLDNSSAVRPSLTTASRLSALDDDPTIKPGYSLLRDITSRKTVDSTKSVKAEELSKETPSINDEELSNQPNVNDEELSNQPTVTADETPTLNDTVVNTADSVVEDTTKTVGNVAGDAGKVEGDVNKAGKVLKTLEKLDGDTDELDDVPVVGEVLGGLLGIATLGAGLASLFKKRHHPPAFQSHAQASTQFGID
jgi:hypothetical protein